MILLKEAEFNFRTKIHFIFYFEFSKITVKRNITVKILNAVDRFDHKFSLFSNGFESN